MSAIQSYGCGANKMRAQIELHPLSILCSNGEFWQEVAYSQPESGHS